jgi:hypothetical protein
LLLLIHFCLVSIFPATVPLANMLAQIDVMVVGRVDEEQANDHQHDEEENLQVTWQKVDKHKNGQHFPVFTIFPKTGKRDKILLLVC